MKIFFIYYYFVYLNTHYALNTKIIFILFNWLPIKETKKKKKVVTEKMKENKTLLTKMIRRH